MDEGIERAAERVARLTRARAAATGVQPGPRLPTSQNRRRAIAQLPSPAQSPAGQFWHPRRGRPRGQPRRNRLPTPQSPAENDDDEWGGIPDPGDEDQAAGGQDERPEGQNDQGREEPEDGPRK